ncbi:hypothetical protein [Escherichia coli]|uniref:hypothetical protein n=1 Tax=Escherichia coli TaxID=562 RepID=UPI001C635294|nr:hypothetical protein [Escherichia coli]MBW7392000.1 hypothetical protein [Escherichia coli]
MITCKKCGENKPPNGFYPRNKVCKECTKKRVTEYQKGIGKLIHNNACKKYNKSEKGKVALIKARENYLESHRQRQQARWSVKRAIKSGKLCRPTTCQKCNSKCHPDAHHCDYSKPLEVMWLCKACHVEWHKHNKPIYPDEEPVTLPFPRHAIYAI